jgi:hypothetical protein
MESREKRNTILAIVLSFFILGLWSYFFGPVEIPLEILIDHISSRI